MSLVPLSASCGPFILIQGFSQWFAPGYRLRPFHRLIPSAWNCECCPTPRLPCRWEGSTPHACAHAMGCLSELSAGLLATVVPSLGNMPYPQTRPPPATAATRSAPEPLFCSQRREASFPNPDAAPPAPPAAVSDHAQQSPDTGCSALCPPSKLSAKEQLCSLGQSISWVSPSPPTLFLQIFTT